MASRVTHEPGASRFTLDAPGGLAWLDYALRGGRVMDIHFTWTPPADRGAGVAGLLVRAALEHARAQGYQVVPSCGYVAAWIRRHPEYGDLVGR